MRGRGDGEMVGISGRLLYPEPVGLPPVLCRLLASYAGPLTTTNRGD